ncbi:MAG: methyl-accepting chemotaxis protein [Betaproteobacteria bacterium]|nr:methyl-accepting chemotaxis protein [Betaproteobacteria bacterium]
MTTSRNSFGDLPIATKLIIAQSIALLILFVVAITWLTEWTTQTAIRDQTETIQQVSQQTLSMIRVFNSTLETNATRMGNVLKNTLPSGYTLDTAHRVEVAGLKTPTLRAGNEVLNLNFEVVDHFTTLFGSVGTIFVRDGEDFVRVSTSLRKENGERAIGTKLDRAHPAYAALLAKLPYTGKALLFGRYYMTYYLPIQDASGAVVGALFTGYEYTKEMDTLRKSILEARFGKNGYMFVIDSGKNAGTMVAHPTLEGKNMADATDEKGFAYIRAMLEQKNGVISYWFVNTDAGETKARKRISIFNEVPEWEWIIVSGLDGKDLDENAANVRNYLIIGAVALGALLFVVVLFTARRWVSRPLTESVGAMEEIARGHLNIAIPAHGKDEVGRLLEATDAMANKMRSALGDIQNAAEQLGISAEHLVRTSHDSADQSAQQSDSAAMMASGIEEMNNNIINVSNSAKQAHQVSADAEGISGEGVVVIQHATESMTRIAGTVRAASEAVSKLGRESQAISNIVNVIREIADQTNLLALNAAIEAARAGEQGRGFAVVADEVRKLAERTATSTQEISPLIQRILDGTAHAVSSMEEGVQQVEEGVSYAGQAGGSIESIRQSAGQATTATTAISEALAEQLAAIGVISRNVEKVSSMADNNSRVAQESAQCASELEQLARMLRERVSHFSI